MEEKTILDKNITNRYPATIHSKVTLLESASATSKIEDSTLSTVNITKQLAFYSEFS